jgi:hypothetical protein
MELFRAHAFSVSPSKGSSKGPIITGGVLSPSTELKGALSEAGKAAKLGERTDIEFNVNTQTRTCDMRDRLMEFGFGNSEQAKSATADMANRLSESMDNRSSSCLFIATSYKEEETRRTNVLWVFPRDDAFQLTRRGDEPSIELLKDIFAKSSNLRKGALFSGSNTRAGHLQGKAFDMQSGAKSTELADFWIVRFLDCRLMITDEQGTKVVAEMFRKFYKQSNDLSSKEAAYGAMISLKNSRRKRWSIKNIASELLNGEDGRRFLRCAPNEECKRSEFNFNKEVFQDRIGTRVFHLNTEVIVASPFAEIGKSVSLNGKGNRDLVCKGTVMDESIRKKNVKTSR